jgi:hypothetical protein
MPDKKTHKAGCQSKPSWRRWLYVTNVFGVLSKPEELMAYKSKDRNWQELDHTEP